MGGFNTQPPEGGWSLDNPAGVTGVVSTHSRLKAAGHRFRYQPLQNKRFNTQPPEGGWLIWLNTPKCLSSFNTQPPEGGWQRLHRKARRRRQFQHTAA